MVKRLLVLVFLLGVAGAVAYAVRAKRSAPEPMPAGGRSAAEADDASAGEMRIREAGSATA